MTDTRITLHPNLAEDRKDLFDGGRQRRRVMTYPFDRMDVGDGFTIGPVPDDELDLRARRVRSAASRYGQNNDTRYQCIRSSDEGMIYVIRRA